MKHLGLSAVLIAAIGYASAAQAVRLPFRGASNTTQETTGAGEEQLTVDIIELSDARRMREISSFAEFRFTNSGPAAFQVVGIYFESDDLLGQGFQTGGSAGVAFEESQSIPTFPGGGNFFPDRYFQAVPEITRDGVGIGPGQNWAVGFDLLFGQTLEDVIQALIDGTLRIGLVAEFSDGTIESFLSDASGLGTIIPLPQGAGLAAIGLLSLAAIRRRRLA
jgi:opacity protein-like surface antigen